MMKILFVFLFLIAFMACQNEGGTAQEEKPKVETKEQPDPRMQSRTAQVSDREPEIQMINVDFVADQDTSKALYKAWIQNKDAKYYHIDGLKGHKLYFELTGGHPAIELIIIGPDDNEIFRKNLDKEPIEWTKVLPENGRYTFIVSLDPKLENKDQVKTYFEAKMRLY